MTSYLTTVRQMLESQLNAGAREEALDLAIAKMAEAYHRGVSAGERGKRKASLFKRRRRS